MSTGTHSPPGWFDLAVTLALIGSIPKCNQFINKLQWQFYLGWTNRHMEAWTTWKINKYIKKNHSAPWWPGAPEQLLITRNRPWTSEKQPRMGFLKKKKKLKRATDCLNSCWNSPVWLYTLCCLSTPAFIRDYSVTRLFSRLLCLAVAPEESSRTIKAINSNRSL